MMSSRMAPLRRIVPVSNIPTRGEDERHRRVLALQAAPWILLRAHQRGHREEASHGQERSSYQRPLFVELEASNSRHQSNKHHWQIRKGLSRERSDSRISEANGHRQYLQH